MKTPFLIDTDTASDDAVALIMAFGSQEIQVAAITAVAGNVAVQQAARNALYTAEICGSDVPVFIGAEKPLKRAHAPADWFHGKDGLGDHGYPAPRRKAEKQSASDAIVETIKSHPGLVLVTLGPLTNVAFALQKNPGIAAQVSRCVIMGGETCGGNVTPAAEYNIWCDPEAARIVVSSGLPIELVGWNLSRGEAVLTPADIQRVLGFGTRLAKFAVECNSRAQEAFFEQTGENGMNLPDPDTMAVALDPPSVVTSRSKHFVQIETESELTRGMTVVDRLNVAANERNRDVWASCLASGHKVEVVWTIDSARWKEALYAALK